MKIHIVGGGPSGLYFAVLMKIRDPAHEIHIFERNPRDNTFGWGVVFSRRTLQSLGESDPASHHSLMESALEWEDVVISYRDQVMHIGGNHFVGIERIALLNRLQARCEELGVHLHFEHDVESPLELQECDLLVGADGVNSRVRDSLAEHLQPTVEPARNRYIWLGTHQPFQGLTLTFRPGLGGLFVAHSYNFAPGASTFIIECDEATYQKSKLPEVADGDSLNALQEVFAQDLGGHSLLSNSSRWIRFQLVKNEQWIHQNVVLLGDACHTAHFSVGSGTKLAMEDSIALAEAFDDSDSVAAGLATYQQRRKPVVDDFQKAAHASLVWFEEAHQKMHMDPLPFAMDCMSRSTRLELDRLRRRDPDFVARYERYVADNPDQASA